MRRSARWVLAGTLMFALAGCGTSGYEPPPTTFVGQIQAAEASVAVVVGGHAGEVTVYVCDGVDTAVWYFGTMTGDVIEAVSASGAVVQARVADGEITGRVELPALGVAEFSAPRATGVAGIYLVDQSATKADGHSVSSAHLEADITATGDGATVLGTVTVADREPLSLQGTVTSFGDIPGVATWIVQSDGEVKGKSTSGQAGGGATCSNQIWKSIKSALFGVHCEYYLMP